MILHGAYFTGAFSVRFGTEESPAFTVLNDTTIECTVPAGTGDVVIYVETPFGIGSYHEPIGGAAPLPGYSYPATYSLLLNVDFTSFTPGFLDASTFHAQTYTAPTKTDLVFNRKYSENSHTVPFSALGETVQTSPSSLIQSALSTQTDTARIGNRTATASKRGLVLEHTRFNYLGAATAGDLSSRKFGSGSATYSNWLQDTVTNCSVTYPSSASPNQSGTGGSHVVASGYSSMPPFGVPSNWAVKGFGPYHTLDRTANVTVSCWQLGAGQMEFETNNAGLAGLTASSGATWERLVISASDRRDRFVLADGRNSVGRAGVVTVECDYASRENGDFATEAMCNARSSCPADRLIYNTGSALIADNGQIKLFERFSPKFASTMSIYYDELGNLISSSQTKSAAWFLFSYGAAGASYAKIKDSDHKLYVKLQGGTEVASTNAIAFSQYDEIELYLAVGNNVASVAKYRLNGGAWVDLVLATIPNAPAPGASPVRFNSDDTKFWYQDTGTFTMWLHQLAMYKTGAPAGV